MADVARAAGVHQTTVSRALRNDRRLPVETRERIQNLAERMGYRPHPLVSALIALRRRRHPPRFNATIAFITTQRTLGDTSRLHFQGAREIALELGYRVELFVVGPEGLSESRLNSVLLTRNVQGVLLAPFTSAHGQFRLDWEQFCTVAIEYTFADPEFDRVVHDSYSGMRQIMRVCRERGRRRVGLTLSTVGHERTDCLNVAAFWMEQKADRFFAPILPLIQSEWDEKTFSHWQATHEIDVVVTSNAFLSHVEAWATRQGRAIGKDFHLVNVNVLTPGRTTGIFQNPVNIGITAARLAIQKIMTDNRGAPPVRHTTLTPGQWVEGETLVSMTRQA